MTFDADKRMLTLQGLSDAFLGTHKVDVILKDDFGGISTSPLTITVARKKQTQNQNQDSQQEEILNIPLSVQEKEETRQENLGLTKIEGVGMTFPGVVISSLKKQQKFD